MLNLNIKANRNPGRIKVYESSRKLKRLNLHRLRWSNRLNCSNLERPIWLFIMTLSKQTFILFWQRWIKSSFRFVLITNSKLKFTFQETRFWEISNNELFKFIFYQTITYTWRLIFRVQYVEFNVSTTTIWNDEEKSVTFRSHMIERITTTANLNEW